MSDKKGLSPDFGEVLNEAAMDIALTTPVAEGRQGADSEKRPAEVRRSGPEPHFWEISGSSLGYQASKVNNINYSLADRRDWFPGGPGGKG